MDTFVGCFLIHTSCNQAGLMGHCVVELTLGQPGGTDTKLCNITLCACLDIIAEVRAVEDLIMLEYA